jgi:sortase (surface protein transpeptidase)
VTAAVDVPSESSWLRASGVDDAEPHPGDHWVAASDSAAGDVPALGPRLQLARTALVIVAVLSTTLLLQLLIISSLQQSAAQERAFDSLRSQIARGVAPVGPTDADGRVLAAGAPVAFMEIPEIGLRQVIGEGTTSSVLFDGPGHRRDTPLPGQVGVSVVFGRRATFGGPFRRIGELETGDAIVVTTGQGVFEYSVIGVRREGDPLPPAPEPGTSRLLLATADGRPFLPNGVLRVDADLTGDAVGGAPRLVTATDLAADEQLMAADTNTLFALVLWLQALIALALAAVWSWHRWGRPQTWIVFLPPLLLVGLATSGEVARLLPNLS